MSCGRCLLLIADETGDRALIMRELRREFPALRVTQVAEPGAFVQALEGAGFDVVIADHRLYGTDFLAALRAVAARWPYGPAIIWTAPDLDEIAVEPVQDLPGSFTFMAPMRSGRLSVAVRMALEQARQRRALEDAEARYRDLFEGVPVGLYRTTPAGQILTPTRPWCRCRVARTWRPSWR